MIPVLLRMQVRFEQLLQSKPDAVGNSAMPTLLKVLLRAGSPPSRDFDSSRVPISLRLPDRTDPRNRRKQRLAGHTALGNLATCLTCR